MKKYFAFIFPWLLASLLILASAPAAMATHIVGGEMSYICLGGNNYQLRFSIYRDCISGQVSAINSDNPALISIFTLSGIRERDLQIQTTNTAGNIVPPNFQNDCVVNPPRTCLNRMDFVANITLNNIAAGYKIIYQSCCRNGTINNIVDPTNAGVTYTAIIPAITDASCNNSAIFKNFPPQIICINNPLVYDHSATDADGDSLSYAFCESYDTPEKSNEKTYPLFFYDPVRYRNPYTYLRPMGGNPLIQIDPRTGIISGTPNILGRFVVSVCCKEWRNGKVINTATREFQFEVTNCSKAVVANIPQYSEEYNTYIVNCKNNTVTFENTSVGGSTYFWDFGDPSREGDTSTEFQPTYTYSDSGRFEVLLIVNKGSTCSDSIRRFVKVYPKLRAQFIAPTFACPGDLIQFANNTESFFPIDSFVWNFDDQTPNSTDTAPSHRYTYGGLYNVGLIATNKQGCLDTVFQKIEIDPFKPDAGNDTFIVKGERIDYNIPQAGSYQWQPSYYLNNPLIPNPVGFYPDTGSYTYIITGTSPRGCIATDTIQVVVISDPANGMPNIFTPNGDGLNDRFRPLLVGYRSVRYFRIYNRYGQEMFSTTDISQSWDGRFNGQLQEIGVYYWMLGLVDRFGKDTVLKGDVTLIR